jgi:hypothetical protein
VPTRSRLMFQEVVESADERVLVRLKSPDGVVHEVWVELDEVSGLEPGATIELIEEGDAGMGPRIVRVDRGNSP